MINMFVLVLDETMIEMIDMIVLVVDQHRIFLRFLDHD